MLTMNLDRNGVRTITPAEGETPESRCRKLHPEAFAERLDRTLYRGPRGGRYEWSIRLGTAWVYLGFGDTESEAWAEADAKAASCN